MRALLAHVNLIRLDLLSRIRGRVAYTRRSAQLAKSGEWVPGAGRTDLFTTVQTQLGTLPFIAEDLGFITPDVRRDARRVSSCLEPEFSSLPLMGAADNPYLPGNYIPNTVVYTGTHDNNTTRGWFAELSEQQRQIRAGGT